MAIQALPSVEAHARKTVDELFDFVSKQGSGDYLGENVSQLQHSLQAATLAQKAGADDEVVLGALLHDVGRFIPAADKMESMIDVDGTYVGKASHEVVGERYLRQVGFSDKICQLVGAHVVAKRYLTAVDQGYYEGLSQSSKTTLKFQGGPFTAAEVEQAGEDPLLEAKLSVRRWDDQAKDPQMQTPDLHSFGEMAMKSLIKSRSRIELRGKVYRLPTRPSVVICVEGLDPQCLKHGIADSILPNLAKLCATDFYTCAESCMPSFTNPNDVSRITEMSPAIRRLSGNFSFDAKTGDDNMVFDHGLQQIGSTILEQMENAGVRVAAITAEDRQRKIVQRGLKNVICFSSEQAASPTLEENNISNVEEWLGSPQPSQNAGESSMYVLRAGIKLLEEDRADLVYLSLSDCIQQNYTPGSKEFNDFIIALDDRIGQLLGLGACVMITGDHGTSDKWNKEQ